MKKILIVFGTRPEAIKMAPLVLEFQKHRDLFDTKVCATAQHRQMLDQVLNVFKIQADYDLDIMAPGQDLFDITSKVLLGMRAVLDDCKPDLVLVHGDTTTSMAAGLAAYYRQIKVGHVEAGLRTYNKYAPWPEEMNRQLTDRISDYFFVPTELTKKNLLDEGIKNDKVVVTGNTVIDALLQGIKLLDENLKLKNEIEHLINSNGYPFTERFYNNKRNYILITGHRRENFGEGFLNICNAIKEIALSNPKMDIVYPVHLNPNVQQPVYKILNEIENVFLIKPLDYLPFLYLMKNCFLILTDSGGIQEEAPTLKKPVLVMREVTERPEAVNEGTVRLVGTNSYNIINSVNELINCTDIYNLMANGKNPYGNGEASIRIVEFLSLLTQ